MNYYIVTRMAKLLAVKKQLEITLSYKSSSSKKLDEDHNLNELENKSEQDGRLVNGHVGRSFNGGNRSSPLRVPNRDYEDSDSGDSSNTSTSSGPGGSKKESQNKTTQV
jgi:hypothetical protein